MLRNVLPFNGKVIHGKTLSLCLRFNEFRDSYKEFTRRYCGGGWYELVVVRLPEKMLGDLELKKILLINPFDIVVTLADYYTYGTNQ